MVNYDKLRLDFDFRSQTYEIVGPNPYLLNQNDKILGQTF